MSIADENWHKAELIVKKACNGQFTPGSGNKKVKGDVIMYKQSVMIEVKQTDKEVMTLQALWFKRLLKFRGKKEELILAVFFELRGYLYVLEGNSESDEWSTCGIKEEQLPSEIKIDGTVWKLYPLSFLRELQ